MKDSVTFGERAAELENLFATHPLIRAVNFHSTSQSQAEHYERQLSQYSRFFFSGNEDELDE
ncbi:MAG: hypothetical protein NVS1B6_02410 [Steroidobacteraceae bacterium]